MSSVKWSKKMVFSVLILEKKPFVCKRSLCIYTHIVLVFCFLWRSNSTGLIVPLILNHQFVQYRKPVAQLTRFLVETKSKGFRKCVTTTYFYSILKPN